MTPQTLSRSALPLLLLLSGLQTCSAQVDSALNTWPIECVGRMQMQLPGSADTAAFSFKRMREFIKSPGVVHGLTFSDNVPAPFAGGFLVSHPLTTSQKDVLLSEAREQKKSVALETEQRRKKQGAKFPDVSDLPPFFDPATMVGWQIGGNRVAVYRMVGESMTEWGEQLRNSMLILNARPRPIFEVPKEPGLCLPYIFVPDDETAQRGLSMSFRLKEHPDIQITLTDASAFKPQNLNADHKMAEAEVKLRNKNAEPDEEIGYFWLERLNAARKYESQWLLPRTTRPVTLAGYEGRQSFVRLTMDDGTLNYGYYAVVRGDPEAAKDTPDLRLYVRQDVRQAQGKAPLTKEQFIEMAQAIAKSVQRRPTTVP